MTADHVTTDPTDAVHPPTESKDAATHDDVSPSNGHHLNNGHVSETHHDSKETNHQSPDPAEVKEPEVPAGDVACSTTVAVEVVQCTSTPAPQKAEQVQIKESGGCKCCSVQ